MTPEFSRPERLDAIGPVERQVEIVADAAERAALAARFGVMSIEALSARLAVRGDAGGILVRGRVTAALTQACTVTGDPLATAIDEAIDLRFVEPGGSEEEIELSDDALDTVEIEGGAIDLGEAAAETVALAIDPYPRGPGAGEALKAAGVIGEDEVTNAAFSGLAALKARLEGKPG